MTYILFLFSILPAQTTYNLYSPEIELPPIGGDETMHFGFWLHADMPDSDGDEDTGLDDYYNISLILPSAWHSINFNSNDGNIFWCGLDSDNGYSDGWETFLDTPPILIGIDGELSAKIFYAIESAAGAAGEVEGSCTDGWDVANIRISKDGGAIWALLEDESNPYHFDCGYGWIFNDEKYESGGALNHLAKGWGGNSDGWFEFSADLTDYAGEEIIIRFAFGSDPAYSTADDGNGNPVPSLTGFQVDNISITDDLGEIFSDFGEDMSQMIAAGEIAISQFYDYGSIEDGRPGASGWEEYVPGMPFNGNVLMDISEYAQKSIKFRFQSRYDGNHDSGQGNGLFIDDFKIYKISTAIYPAPEGLSFELGSGAVTLTWTDMNAGGTDDFVFHNGYFSEDGAVSLSEEGSAWVGEKFKFIGPSTVDIIKVISINADPVEVTIGGFESSGGIIKSQPTYSLDVTLEPGENTFDAIGWEMNNSFIIGYSFSDVVIAGLDSSLTSDNSWVMISGTWDKWSDLVDVNEELNHGDWGISAIITYDGAGVTYNVYRNGAVAASGLTDNSHTDTDLTNNTTYEYTVSATYADGEESEESDAVTVTPFADTVHEEGYDDGTSEVEFGGQGLATKDDFSAVRFTANASGESIFRFKWYQNGPGGAFYIKIFEDNDGIPGNEISSTVQASGNTDGWNEKDLSSEGLNVFGDFWIGVKEFSSSMPFGLDTDSNSGNSYKRIGENGNWEAVEGNLMYRILLDCGDNCDESAGREFAQAEDEMEHFFQVPIYQFSMQNKKPSLVPVIINGNPLYRKQKITNDLERSYPVDGDEIILFEYDFENSEANDWTNDNGWILTEIESNSPTHSFNSPNDDIDGLEVENGLFPIKFGINQIYPNPFNPAANIQFEISEISQVELSIYNLNGRLVSTLVNAFVNPGMYTSVWNGVDSFGNPVSSGIYFAVLESNKKLIQTQKLVLLK